MIPNECCCCSVSAEYMQVCANSFVVSVLKSDNMPVFVFTESATVLTELCAAVIYISLIFDN